MLQTYQFCFLVIIAFAFCFPQDATNGVTLAWLWILTRILNYYLMFRAWLMYCRLRSDFAKMGLPMPAFKFVPIWERNGSN